MWEIIPWKKGKKIWIKVEGTITLVVFAFTTQFHVTLSINCGINYCLFISKLQWYHKCIIEWISNLTPHVTGHVISMTYPCHELGFKLIHDARNRGSCNVSSWLLVPCLNEWVTGINGLWKYRLYNMSFSGMGIFIIKIRYPISQDPSIPVRRHIYTETDPRGPVHERFSQANSNSMETWF